MNVMFGMSPFSNVGMNVLPLRQAYSKNTVVSGTDVFETKSEPDHRLMFSGILKDFRNAWRPVEEVERRASSASKKTAPPAGTKDESPSVPEKDDKDEDGDGDDKKTSLTKAKPDPFANLHGRYSEVHLRTAQESLRTKPEKEKDGFYYRENIYGDKVRTDEEGKILLENGYAHVIRCHKDYTVKVSVHNLVI